MSWLEKKLFQYVLNGVFPKTKCKIVPYYSKKSLRCIFEMLFNHLYTVYYKAGNDKVNEYLIESFKDLLVSDDRTGEYSPFKLLNTSNSKDDPEDSDDSEKEDEDAVGLAYPVNIGEPIIRILKLWDAVPERFEIYGYKHEKNDGTNISFYDKELKELFSFDVLNGYCESHTWMTRAESCALLNKINTLLLIEEEDLKKSERAELCKKYKL